MKKSELNSLLLLPLFEKFISACKHGRRTKYGSRKLTAGTIEQYDCVKKLLIAYEPKHNIILKIAVLKKYSLALLRKQTKYWKHFFRSFTTFLYRHKGCYDTYVGSVCKVLRTFFNYLSEEKHLPIGTFHKSFKVPQQTFAPLILEPTKLQFLIMNKAFEASLPQHLKRTKDLFVFGCTVALRYSDLMNLRKGHLIEAPEGTYLQMHTQKTATLVKLPLPEYLLAIVEKYNQSCRQRQELCEENSQSPYSVFHNSRHKTITKDHGRKENIILMMIYYIN